MQPIRINPIKKPIQIRFDGKKVSLPPAIQKKVDDHWATLISDNPRLHNGEAFTVTHVKETDKGIEIDLHETNYAHYLYSHQVGGLGKYTVRIIHTAALVITADGKLIFGKMSRHTSRPGIIQCCGGGIDRDDIQDGVVNIEQNTMREINEELGIDPYNKALVDAFSLSCLKTGGPTGKMTIVYTLHTKETGAAFLQAYNTFAERLGADGQEPEFESLYCIDAAKSSIEAFLTGHGKMVDEYMTVLLRQFCH